MRRVVVHNQMNIELSRNGAIDMLQEFDELFMPVTGQATLNDFPRERVESGEQGRCPVSSVFVRLTRRGAFPQRQDRRSSLQSLNAALFVDTQDDRIGRWIHVQPDDIPELINEVRVRAKLEVLNSMRLQIMCAPQPVNCTAAHAKATGHLITCPLSGIFGRGLHRRRNDLRRRIFAAVSSLISLGRPRPAAS
jgi:hypothetical protein